MGTKGVACTFIESINYCA